MPRKRKRRSVIPWLVLTAAAALAVWLLLANVVFVVRDIQVVGAGSIPEADVRKLSGIQLGRRLSALDEAEVAKCVESDGRLAFVSLERHLPNRVVLAVRPRSRDALVLIAGAGRVLVLDSDGFVVEVTSRLPDAVIPYVSGLRVPNYVLGKQLDTADGRCGCMTAVLEALKANGATAYASEISVADTADLRIITRKGTTVLLGDKSNMDRKIAWMGGALADLEARGENGGRLDVSSGNKADYTPASLTGDETAVATTVSVEQKTVQQTEVDTTNAKQTQDAPEGTTGAETGPFG